MRFPFVFLAMFMGMAQVAVAQTTAFADYEAMDEAGQSRTVNAALARIFDGYKQQGREDVSNCMTRYFLSAPEGGGLPSGYVQFARTIATLRNREQVASELPSIERILFNIVKDECLNAEPGDQ